jgi:hypothetical protein
MCTDPANLVARDAVLGLLHPFAGRVGGVVN